MFELIDDVHQVHHGREMFLHAFDACDDEKASARAKSAVPWEERAAVVKKTEDQ